MLKSLVSLVEKKKERGGGDGGGEGGEIVKLRLERLKMNEIHARCSNTGAVLVDSEREEEA